VVDLGRSCFSLFESDLNITTEWILILQIQIGFESALEALKIVDTF
jgi:hypothetical protein